MKLVSMANAAALDRSAAAWGLSPDALVEAAGRGAAAALVEGAPDLFGEKGTRIVVAVGSGNNGADALVLLKTLLLQNRIAPENARVITSRVAAENETGPRAAALRLLAMMGVMVAVWDGQLPPADIIIDGIAGSGLKGALAGAAAAMVAAINADSAWTLSIDVPSGNFDTWEPNMPLVRADVTAAIEPLKSCLYNPAARPFAGSIVSVGAIFPPALIERFAEAERLDEAAAYQRLPRIKADAYKYERGVVTIHAGCAGSAGAARIAAKGAAATGAGLVRLIVDADLYPALASPADGIMVVAAEEEARNVGRFVPDALLLGPGWGTAPDRRAIVQTALAEERAGTPLILDADALTLAKDAVFSGNTILTPHIAEFERFSGHPRTELLAHPLPSLIKTAREKRATVLFKSHVLFIVAEDGRVGIVDGMAPLLAAGGSGDLLAGICAGLAARMKRAFDGYDCACAAASLFMAAGTSLRYFADPLELAAVVSQKAFEAWVYDKNR